MSANLVTVDAGGGIGQVFQVMAEKVTRRVLVLHTEEVIGVTNAKMVMSTLRDGMDTVSTQMARLQSPWR